MTVSFTLRSAALGLVLATAGCRAPTRLDAVTFDPGASHRYRVGLEFMDADRDVQHLDLLVDERTIDPSRVPDQPWPGEFFRRLSVGPLFVDDGRWRLTLDYNGAHVWTVDVPDDIDEADLAPLERRVRVSATGRAGLPSASPCLLLREEWTGADAASARLAGNYVEVSAGDADRFLKGEDVAPVGSGAR